MEFRDLKKQYQILKQDIDAAMVGVASSGGYIGGKYVTELEGQLADYVGVKHCISCANGTDALSLALMAWDIKEGDAVFVPDFTFFASAEVVAFEGATPIFVDVENETFNISSTDLERKIQSVIAEGKLTPKVIITVDLFELPASYSEIRLIADRYNLLIL
ncbi:MAG: aminotransferase class I/II-fold pyridoxal phosphate-dependent enzyme, partial [Clostridia bacterium]